MIESSREDQAFSDEGEARHFSRWAALRQLSAIVGDAARRDESLRRLEVALAQRRQ